MIIKKRRHRVPGLNTTPTADISFMLLIFFLVTTSLDVDKGLQRQLPPARNKSQQQVTDVDKRTLMTIKITSANEIRIDERPVKASQLQQSVEVFVSRLGNKHLISLDTDPSAGYQTYINVQNSLLAAYRNVRNRLALERFGKTLETCTSQQKETIREAYPMRMTENYNQKAGENRP